ncbi:hypothetical protein ACFYOV_02595 [Streptomyces sp. NPDC005931]|uniref:hypothetical protein n=1 Tax=Streptomyces sp. NPDC005931 TaxID=3364737 RepID=UPI0036C92192
MTAVHFQLAHVRAERERLRWRRTHTWAGTVPGAGQVELLCPADEDRSHDLLITRVSGRAVPPMSFGGIAFRGLPRMARMRLVADGHTADLGRRHLAVTRQGRALRIAVAGRSYRYRVLGSDLRHELAREGAVVTTTRSGRRHPRTISGVAQGGADALDIGIALLLEGAYTRNLSFGGAVYSWPGRFLSRLDLDFLDI